MNFPSVDLSRVNLLTTNGIGVASDSSMVDSKGKNTELNTNKTLIKPAKLIIDPNPNSADRMTPSPLQPQFINPKEAKEMTTNANDVASTSSIVHQKDPQTVTPPNFTQTPGSDEAPVSKKPRLDGNEELYQSFKSMERSIGDMTSSVMEKIQQINSKSYTQICQLLDESQELKEKIRLLELQKHENENEIKRLIEENKALRPVTECKDCGKKLNTLSYCNEDCHENAFR